MCAIQNDASISGIETHTHTHNMTLNLLFFDKIPNNRQCDKFDFEHKKKTMGEEREKKAAARTLSLLHIIKSVFVTLSM